MLIVAWQQPKCSSFQRAMEGWAGQSAAFYRDNCQNRGRRWIQSWLIPSELSILRICFLHCDRLYFFSWYRHPWKPLETIGTALGFVWKYGILWTTTSCVCKYPFIFSQTHRLHSLIYLPLISIKVSRYIQYISRYFHCQRDLQVANLATVGYPLYYSAPAVAALWELIYASDLSDLSDLGMPLKMAKAMCHGSKLGWDFTIWGMVINLQGTQTHTWHTCI